MTAEESPDFVGEGNKWGNTRWNDHDWR